MGTTIHLTQHIAANQGNEMIRKRTGRRTNVSKKAAHRVAVAAKTPQAPQPKFAPERKHLRCPVAKPSWPASADQRKQSRPVIYERPMRAIVAGMLMHSPSYVNGIRTLSRAQRDELRGLLGAPKHYLDAAAARA